MTRRKAPTPKPRRDFRAWLLYTLIQQGAELPDDPPYKLVQQVLAQRGLKPVAPINGDRP